MSSRPAITKLSVAAAILFSFLGISPRLAAQGLQQKLESTYALTKPTDDKSDIVTAGAILILQKDKIIMYSTSNQVLPQNTYKAGKLSEGAFGVHDNVQKFGSFIGHPPPQAAQTQSRQFVTGEKFWVTGIAVQGDGVVFTLFTDAIQDVRYQCTLKFLYPKGTTPSTDDVLKTVAEVFKVQEDDSAKSDDKQQPAADAQPAADQAPAAEQAPPAPPATVAIGQSTDEVVAILGQPEKILNLGAKVIYVYKDLKVTFVKGKVTDAQ
ncbi:MAG: hypothetical protein WCD43_07965 [Candidatus Acidiferrales bacterium]